MKILSLSYLIIKNKAKLVTLCPIRNIFQQHKMSNRFHYQHFTSILFIFVLHVCTLLFFCRILMVAKK